MLSKIIAKRIIVSAPCSAEYSLPHISGWPQSILENIDRNIQYSALRLSDSFTEEDWGEIQLVKLKKILIHAGYNVPYWQKLFKKIKFNPELFRNFEDLERIPIIRRGDLKKIPREELMAKNIPASRAVEAVTSGSTGEPLAFYQDQRDRLRRKVNTLLEFRYAGISPYAPVVILGLDNHPDLNNYGWRFGMGKIKNDEEYRKKLYKYIKLLSVPPLLVVNPSDLRMFASIIKSDHENLKFSGIFYRGGPLSAMAKKDLSKFFCCQLFTTYGTRECSLLGVECEIHRLHTVPWMNYLEVVDGVGRRLSYNSEGSVVVTFFENYVMPFIRYELGDGGLLKKENCPCGRVSGCIEIHGRASVTIVAPNSPGINLLGLTKYLDENYHSSILQYQFIQECPDQITLLYVPYPGLSIDESIVKEYFAKVFNYRMNIFLKIVMEIPSLAGGKAPTYINNIKEK